MLLLALWACALATGPTREASVVTRAEGARDLPVRLTWPRAGGPWPVVVFSHGLGGSREGYEPLVGHWAAHGFLVIQPTHPDSLALRTPAERARLRDPEELLNDPTIASAWRERRAEIGRVLDRLDELARAAGFDPSLVDRERVGVGGHSFGAHTAMLAGGLSLSGPGGRVTFHDPEERADAILLISPQGTGAGITPASFAGIDRPTLMVTGSEDRSPIGGQGPEWRMEVWEGLPRGERWLLWIDGAGHGFGGISGRVLGGPADPEQVGWVQQATLAFWQATLRGDAAARAWLDGDGLTTGSGGRARIERGPTGTGSPRRRRMSR